MRWGLRAIGCLLIVPLVVVAVAWIPRAAACQDECHGNVVYAVLLLLLALPALGGLIVLASTLRDE